MADGALLDPTGLQALIDALRERGFRVLGPTVRDSAIVTAPITGIADLPRGIGDVQAPGHYRITSPDTGRGGAGSTGVDTRAEAFFGFAATTQAAKPVLFPADRLLWRGTRSGADFTVEAPDDSDGGPVALLGIRACDLAAVAIHDQVLLARASTDVHYATQRRRTFLVAVTCGTPAGTCFCASMGTGPRPGEGADLTLTELADPHRFLVEVGTTAGRDVLDSLPSTPATDEDLAAVEAVVAGAVASMGRHLRTDDLHDLLYTSAESPHWADVGARCLACTNCTLVCPTCFCTCIEDVSDLSGDLDERHRVWDSCFSMEYSRLHGGAVRTSTSARYRQWLTHKLAAWIDQFGTSGCVGCGRCITWCPAGIDLTAEVVALRAEAAHRPLATSTPGAATASTAAGPEH
ncbi:MAG: 4Fe-4S dicluster domain-containing protein [Candidatus Nanopelagicales bacterium]